jgi:A/G-specific adenine glycosylase
MDVAALLDWYERVRRPLPWRFTRDPYALLVSEVMLQQTQAPRVVPYWERWLERFPDVSVLAAAPVRDVLASWSGLGYNRRALALQRAASVVAVSGWPADLTSLPGVGPYTAAAVSSFAWDAQVAAVDTNVRRVLSRRAGVDLPLRDVAARAVSLLPTGRAALFNQAMMELGATVCRPRTPACAACPVTAGCVEHARLVDPASPRAEEAAARTRGAAGREGASRGVAGREGAGREGAAREGAGPDVANRAGAAPGVANRGAGPGVPGRAGAGPGVAGRAGAGPGVAGRDGAGRGVAGREGAARGVAGREGAGPDDANREGAAPGVAGRAGAGRGVAGHRRSDGASPAAATRPRFEDTNRWARGRVIAALLANEEPPLSGARLEHALAGLERDGLIVRGPDGAPRLP